VSRGVAQALGWNWVSTGAFYRGLAWVAAHQGVDLQNPEALVQLCNSDSWAVVMAEDNTQVWCQGADVTEQIYGEEIGNHASLV